MSAPLFYKNMGHLRLSCRLLSRRNFKILAFSYTISTQRAAIGAALVMIHTFHFTIKKPNKTFN